MLGVVSFKCGVIQCARCGVIQCARCGVILCARCGVIQVWWHPMC